MNVYVLIFDACILQELISDWPIGNEAEVVSSLHVHPQGWCVVSRNTSNVDKSEWTCVHDIQDTSVDSPIISRQRPRVENEESQPTTSYPVSSSSSSSSSDQSDEDIHQSRVPTTNVAPGPQVKVISVSLQFREMSMKFVSYRWKYELPLHCNGELDLEKPLASIFVATLIESLLRMNQQII